MNDSPFDSLRPDQTADSCLGVKGSPVRIRPSRPEHTPADRSNSPVSGHLYALIADFPVPFRSRSLGPLWTSQRSSRSAGRSAPPLPAGVHGPDAVRRRPQLLQHGERLGQGAAETAWGRDPSELGRPDEHPQL